MYAMFSIFKRDNARLEFTNVVFDCAGRNGASNCNRQVRCPGPTDAKTQVHLATAASAASQLRLKLAMHAPRLASAKIDPSHAKYTRIL